MENNPSTKKPFYKKLWFKIIAGIFIFFFLVSLLPDPEPSSKNDKQSISTSDTFARDKGKVIKEDESDVKDVSYSKIGDEIKVGNFVYRVNSMKYQKTIGSDGYDKTSDGIFLIVNLSLTNLDNEEHTIDNSLFKLTDSEGVEFESSPEGGLALEMTGLETLFLKQCNPKINKKGYLCFEVPEKAIYDLHLSGGYWNGSTAIVKLTDK